MAKWVFVHSSDEMYGSDRVLLDVLAALPDSIVGASTVWLPTDVPHGGFPLCRELARREIGFQHRELPIIRRFLLNAEGMAGLARRSLSLRSALRQESPDVIYCTTSAAALAVRIGARVPNARVIFHLQEVWGSREAPILSRLVRESSTVIAVSEAAARSMAMDLQGRAVHVPNTCSAPASVPELPRGPLRLLYAGRWSRRKGIATLLDAWGRGGSGHELLVAGSAPPSDQGLVGEILAAEAAPGVRIIGQVENLSALMPGVHAVVVPSLEPESFGLTALEAMAWGRPVIASSVGALPEVIGPDAGWLLPPGDVDALAATLSRLSPAEVRFKGIAARQRFDELFARPIFEQRIRDAALGRAIPER